MQIPDEVIAWGGGGLAALIALIYRAVAWVYRDRIQQLTDTVDAYKSELKDCLESKDGRH